MARITRAELAKRVGVSPATVSHIMNGRAQELGFSAQTTEKVQRAAAELGYIPRASARAFRYQTSRTIGLFLGEIPQSLHLPIFNEILLAAIEKATARQAYVVPILCPLEGDYSPIEIARETLKNVDLAGAICEDIEHFWPLAELFQDQEIPVAWMNPRGQECRVQGAAELSIDEAHGVLELFSRIDLPSAASVIAVQGPGVIPERISALENSVQLEVLHCDSWIPRSGVAAAKQILKQDRLPEVIFAANDPLAFGVLACLQETGVSVPNEIQVVGYGGFDQAAYLFSDLTTISWPLAELAAEAVNALLTLTTPPSQPANSSNPIRKVLVSQAKPGSTTRSLTV